MPQINPSVLRWARETAGYSEPDAAQVLHLGGKRRTGDEVLRAYESGAEVPSRAVILKMVKAYHRPLLAFYLPVPPGKGERGEDFRTLPAERQSESAGPLDALVRDVYVRQRLVRATLEEAEEAVSRSFVGSIQLGMSVAEVSRRLIAHLQFDLSVFRAQSTAEDAFKYLRTQVERTGVFVLLIGNLGSHHSNVSVEVFRGFALADDVAPFIVVNDQDAKVAWSFTVLHELVHIWLGETGISGGAPEKGVEQFCNEVASEILLPAAEFAAEKWIGQDLAEVSGQIAAFSNSRNVSRNMVAYRLYQAGHIDRGDWQALTDQFRTEWLQRKAAQKRANSKSPGGPNYYVVKRHYLGHALVDLVRRSMADGILTPTKAGRVLGVRPTNVVHVVEPA